METENIERYLDSYGRYVVQQAKTNLTKQKKNVSKALYNSIKFKVEYTPTGFSVNFYMLDYGTFVDKGVSGNKEIQEFKTWDGRKVESPFKYKSKMPPPNIISKWISARGIRPTGFKRGRDTSSGQFISGLSYLIAKKIQMRGIKSTSFFQKPLGLAMKKFGVGLLEAVKEDMLTVFSDEIKTTIE
jgi:hypothetical protein|tara:strand:- start:171 stop:728 length:558 start_codon:yes stop_codon:yes gene_type:complete